MSARLIARIKASGEVEGELEIWDLGTATCHIWRLPENRKWRDVFHWKGDIVFSPDHRYAALCGSERFHLSWVFVIDLDELKLTILLPNAWADWDLRMQSIDNDQQFVVSNDDYPTVTHWRVDLKSGSVVHKQVKKQKEDPKILEWDAPSSSEASSMSNSMPVQLRQIELPHEIYMMDKSEQGVGQTSGLTARLVE